MTQFTKAIFFKDGNVLTITDKEAKDIIAGLNAGGKWVDVQGEFISADNVARIGDHSSTGDIKKTNNANLETKLKLEGKEDLLKLKKEKERRIAIRSALKAEQIDEAELRAYLNSPDEPAQLMTAEESARGDAEYWVDKKSGNKIYS